MPVANTTNVNQNRSALLANGGHSTIIVMRKANKVVKSLRQLYLRDRATDPSGATVIFDSTGIKRYLLVGKWGMVRDALSLYAMDGQLIGEIKQLSLGILPRFAIYVHHEKIGSISKSLGFVREVIYIHHLHWIIVGNPFADRYRVYKGGRLVFVLEPVEKTGGYYHQLTVMNEEEEPAAILVASILNTWARHSSRDAAKVKFGRRWKYNATAPADFRYRFSPLDRWQQSFGAPHHHHSQY